MPTYVATTKSKARLIVSFGIDYSQMTDLHYYVIYFLLRIFSESIFIAFNLAPEDNGVKFHERKCKLFSVTWLLKTMESSSMNVNANYFP